MLCTIDGVLKWVSTILEVPQKIKCKTTRPRGHGNPLQYSCLENPMDRGAWWAIVHKVAKSET